jgi:transposase-like protein
MDNPFKWRQYQADVILLCVRWFLKYALSYRDLAEMMSERGMSVDHTTIYRWVQRYAPEIDKRSRRYLKPSTDSWRVDETYIKVRGKWLYLYRAVDSSGQTLEFMLNETRSGRAAKRFFTKMLGNSHAQTPRVINVDQNAAYPKAVEALKEAGLLPNDTELRPVKYLNNIVEQDHRFIKRKIKPGLGFSSFPTAWRTLQGIEAMHMMSKGQIEGVNRRDGLAQQQFIHALFGLAA